jgi:drug/metabolite transporter (DMT)-like permease
MRFALMVLLTALWGVQQVVIKLTANDVTPLMQAGIRSIVATVLVLAGQRISGSALWQRDGTLWAGSSRACCSAASSSSSMPASSTRRHRGWRSSSTWRRC